MSWFREPDYSDNYEKLYGIEDELSDGKPARFELLSIWRLARDEKYAEWARKIGPDTCQITLFGMEETTDWFYRREGAFQDCIKATERLLDVGMKPRWQIFLTKKLIPEIANVLELVDKMRLKERVKALGGEFVEYIHLPGPDGEAGKIEYLRPTIEQVKSIPAETVKSSKKHFKSKKLWYTEDELISQILIEEDSLTNWSSYSDRLWFFVDTNWNVFSNLGSLEPWWKLGSLKTDTLENIFDNFENNKILALQVVYSDSAKRLAECFGNPCSKLIYSSKQDLLALWIDKYCKKYYTK